VRRHALPADGRPVVVGRDGADLVLPSPAVSRRHAIIERVGGGHAVRDLGSTNGTFVSGQRVTRAELAAGAVVQIGAFKLVYDGSGLTQIDQRGAVRIDGRNLTRYAGGRPILRDVSLSIAPREFVALVGGSGAGKSTLMKALAAYAPADAGQVLLNGDDFYDQLDAYRAMVGYVPQDDTLHRELPVARALAYAARLRLPADTSGAEIDARVARVLEEVDMTAQRDKRIDRLSGGQRKRVCIAAELLADPSLFFLDEPTSGLDPGLEKRMMVTLRRLADAGRTVVLVTHATANITQCDHVAFVAEGRLVFFGPPREAPAFFGVPGGDFADIYGLIESDAERWEARFRASGSYAQYVARRLAEVPPAPSARRRRTLSTRGPGIALPRQIAVLARRYLHVLAQDPRNLLLLLLQAPVIGYLLTLVAEPEALVGRRANAVDAKTVLFMLSTVAVWFGIINSARELAKESYVFRRERLAGVGVVAYVLSKLVVLVALVVLQSAALLAVLGVTVTYPASGVLLAGPAELLVTTVLTSIAGLSLGLCISAWARTPDRATSLVPLALIPQILFSGVLFPFDAGISPTRVLSWLTASRWAIDAYGTTVNLDRLPPVARKPAPEFAFDPAHLVQCWEILGGFALVCLVLACVLLARRDRDA
jgi:ABC-type multidrug transport system ATPase subunit